MNPEARTKHLCTLLGWQGGTVHDACREIGVDAHEFLHANAQFDEHGPCADFQRGYEQADDVALYLSANKGNLQYFFGAISAVHASEGETKK